MRWLALIAALAVIFPSVDLALAAQENDDRDPGLYAILQTSMGEIVIRLFEEEAPQTVANFVGLATGRKAWWHPATRERQEGTPYYDGLLFHRVIPNFMIQTGDPLGTGTGGPGYTIPDEFNSDVKFDRPGRVGMANVGRPNTGGAQFFITHRATPWLNGRHTILGQVVEGQKVVEAMGKVPRDDNDKPLKPITIKQVTIQRIEAEPTDGK